MEIRRIKAVEIKQAIKLSDMTFREEGHTSMGDAFPHIFSMGANHSFGAFDGDKLVSFIGLVPNKVRIGKATLQVFSIGCVCTHEDYRKRGISSAILKEVYQYIDKAGASLLFVSGDRGMYKRNHCYNYGKTYHYKMKQQSTAEHNYEGMIRLGSNADIFKIDQLRSENNVRFESSLWEWATLLEASGYTSIIKRKQTLYVAEHQGVVEGFVVIGLPNEKSSKQQGLITEWGGDPAIVHRILLNLLRENILQEIEFNIPWHEEYHETLSAHQLEVRVKGSTIYLVDAQRFIEQVKPYLKEKNPDMAEGLEVSKISEQKFRLNYGKTAIELQVEELNKLFFSFQEELPKKELQTLFPIPLPHTEGIYYV